MREVLKVKRLTTAQIIEIQNGVEKGIQRSLKASNEAKWNIPYCPLESKLYDLQREAEEFFYKFYSKFYRVSESGAKGGGNNSITFKFGKTIGCSAGSERVYGKKYPGTNSVIQLWLHPLWALRVLDKGFAIHDGKLTLDAQKIYGEKYYRLIQIKQSLGFSIKTCEVEAHA